MDSALHQLLDFDRYPLDEPDSHRMRALVTDCGADLEERALCMLPGFIRPEVVSRMVAELEILLGEAFRFDQARSAYEADDKEWPSGHPRLTKHDCRYHQILNHQIPNDSLVRQLYLSEHLTEFVRQVLGHETLFRSACPQLALTVHVAGPGDCNGWHYDGNDAVFSLLLAEADSGGKFEYVPHVRDKGNENYEKVAAIFRQPEQLADRPPIRAGTFTLFKGDESIHRVTEIGAESRRRMIAVFSYDCAPNMVFPQEYIDQIRSLGQGVVA
ncbi:MAG TPA: hypothetical protein QGG47_13950 [Acidobacteriota bacterium]|nr:hypothetical protein [Acidobacteriota bacterium]